MTMGVFTIFFGRLAKLPSQVLPYPVFYFAALVPWAYFSMALTNCTNIVVDNQNVITKVYFPRLILPVAAVFSGLADFAIGLVVMVVLTLSFGIHPPATVLLLPFLIVLAVLPALGVGLRDFGAERFVSRRARGNALRRAVLDAGVTRGVPKFSGAGALALVVRTESHGRSDR